MILLGVKQSCLFLFVLSLMVFPAHSFDGNRKGLVAGFGLGLSPYASWHGESGLEETNTGKAFKLLIGYGLDEKNVLALEMLGIYMESDILNNGLIIQGLSGLNWYHFYTESSEIAFFNTFGIGVIPFVTESSPIGGRGLGGKLGAGIEFKRYFQFELNYVFGSTSSIDNFKTNHSVFTVLVTVFAF